MKVKENINCKIYSAIDITKYIINYSIENNYDINISTLNLCLYFLQSASLKNRNSVIFFEDIIATNCGPEVIEVINYFIYELKSLEIKKFEDFDYSIIDDNDKLFIVDGIDFIFDVNFLKEKTQYKTFMQLVSAQSPYRKNWANGKYLISKNELYEYFKDDEGENKDE